MWYTIYRVTHKESGKCYIGKHQTNDPNDGYMGSGRLIKSAIKKHGVEAFEKEVLHIFETEVEMNAKEAELVTDEFCLREDTYNLCPGGQGGWGYVNANQPILHKSAAGSISGLIHSRRLKTDDAYRAKMAEISGSTLKKLHSSGLKKQNTYGMLGRKHSEQTKAKMHQSNSGANNSQYGTMWITDGIVSKKIRKTESIPNGWIQGRK